MASPEEMRNITKQFGNNAEDLNAYLRDLEGWYDEMNKMDEQLRSNSQKQEKKEKKQEDKTKSDNKVPKHQNMENFMDDHMDDNEYLDALKDVGVLAKDATKDDMKNVTKQDLMNSLQADVEKAHGNDCYKKGNYDKAIDYYTKGISLDPYNAVMIANRAMAYLKLNKFRFAEDDCSEAIKLDPTYVKAYQRRGTARIKLKKISDAIKDFEEVLKIDPSDKLAQKEISNLKSPNSAKPVNTSLPVKKKKISDDKPIRKEKEGTISPIKKSIHERSKKPLQRISIIDVENENDLEKIVEEKTISETTSIETETNIEKKTFSKSDSNENLGDKIAPVKEEMASSLINDKKQKTELKPIPPKPTTSIQFTNGWKYLSGEQRIQFLDKLSIKDYSKIFKQSMDSKIFFEIIKTLNEFYTGQRFVTHCKGLSSVPRVSTMIMFMSNSEKEIINNLMAKASNDDATSKSDISQLKSVFLK